MILDLTKTVPRSPFDEIAGFAWLPRMADKARAFYAGTHGEYSPYPCFGDKRFLDYFGLDAEELGTAIKNGATDTELGAYVQARTKRSPAEAAAFRAMLLAPPDNVAMRVIFYLFKLKNAKDLLAKRPDLTLARIDAMAKMIAVEEGHPIPGL